jgi:hypothetical protein
VGRPLSGAELRANGLERRRVLVVAVDVPQQAAELVERRGIETSVLLEAVTGAGLELVEVPARLGHADHRHAKVPTLEHRLQRREDLLVGQVARGAEEHQGVGASPGRHLSAGFST